MEAREAAFKAIYHIIEEGKPSHIVLKGILSELTGDRRDTAFVTRLVEGTVEMLIYLDHCIDFVSKVPVKKQARRLSDHVHGFRPRQRCRK